MDFSLSDEQQAIAELAKQIFRDKATNERQREVEKAAGPRFDSDLYAEAARAGLLGLAISEDHGGAGLGFLEVASVLAELGRATAPIPLYESIVLGALPLERFGSDAQQKEWLPRIAEGKAIVTTALVEDAPTRAVKEGDHYRIEGAKLFVPAAEIADLVLLPAETAAGRAVFLLDPRSKGVKLRALDTTSGQPESAMDLEGVRIAADALLCAPGSGGEIEDWIVERATAALCMITLGVCEAALDLTAEYAKTRKQFDQPIATFQAVGHRAADAFIDTEAIRLTAWQGAWRIDQGLDSAKQIAVAKFWAAEGGKRIVLAAQHLHGGVGVDREYPLHRYYLYARQLELTLGGAATQLRQLGRVLASEAA